MDFQELVAYCGLTCKNCPIYWVSREEDKEKQQKMKAKIAQLGSEHYGIEMTADDITDCDGCRTETGKLYHACMKCEIRQCARTRNLITCAHCSDYSCEKIQKHLKADPSSKIWIELIRSTI
jgi:hypothetical protein